MRRRLLMTALALIAAGSVAASAEATFPGRNGPIAFRRVDPATNHVALFRARPDGTQVSELTDRPGFFSDWRADGRRLAFDFFDDKGNEQIATMTAHGGDLREITSGAGIHELPSWSPSGTSIVFDFSSEANPDAPGFETRLWTMRSNGSRARALPMREPGFDVEPKYAPDGRGIAFMRLRTTSDGKQQQSVFIVSAEGGRVRQLTPWDLNAEHPTWSPDSRWIIFNTSPDGQIEAMRPSGLGRHAILPATEGAGGHKPWFSPDGTRILFMCENQGLFAEPPADYNEDICVMDADGSDVVKVINTPSAFENWPSWGPAPNKHDQG